MPEDSEDVEERDRGRGRMLLVIIIIIIIIITRGRATASRPQWEVGSECCPQHSNRPHSYDAHRITADVQHVAYNV